MSKLLFSEQPLVIDKKLASLLGINEAIVLQQIHYWIEINRKAEKNFHEEKYWTYNTIQDWQKEFPFWSVDTVKRTLAKLRKANILITGNFNKQKRDKTLWYTIDYKELERLAEDDKEESKEKKIEDTEQESEQTKTPEEKNEIKLEDKTEEEQENKSTIGGKEGSISQKCNMPSCKSADCSITEVQYAPMHQGNLHSPLPETTTEITYRDLNQSICQSIEYKGLKIRAKKKAKTKQDLKSKSKAEKHKELSEHHMEIYKKVTSKCNIEFLDENYQDAVTHVIQSFFWDIENKKTIKLADNIIPVGMLERDLEKLNFEILQHAIEKFKAVSREKEIRNTIAYLRACVYHAIHEMNLEIDSNLRYHGLI